MRTPSAVPRKRKKNRLFQKAKGYVGARRKLLRTTKENLVRAEAFAFRDRRVRKREFRKLWIIRIGAAARVNGLNYNKLIHGLKVAGVDLDRKVLADIALQDPAAFTKLAETARKAASA